MITTQPTVIIGLGEAGRRSVAYLKRRIYDAYGPLETVLLLAVTLPEERAAVQKRPAALPYELLPKEELELDLTDAHRGADQVAKDYPWLPAGVLQTDSVDREARAASRLAFMSQASVLIPWLQDNVRAILSVGARDAMAEKGFSYGNDPSAAIYVVAALDDPVGSGLFLDFAYLTRHILHNIGIPDISVTGVFYLPDQQNLTERAGANVYAALKELDAHMSGAPFVRTYTPTVQIGADAAQQALPPFNHGCYLLDTINEKGIALGERDEASAMLGEWLFQASLTACRQPLDGPIAGASSRRRYVEDRLAVYGSLGLAGYILPIDGFVDFCANRLAGQMLETYVLGNVSSQVALEDVGAFQTDQRLTPDSLKANTLQQPGTAPGAQALALLESAPWSELEARARQLMQQLDGDELKAYARQVAGRGKERLDMMPRVLEQQRNQLLNQPDPNLIPLALHFFNGLIRQLQLHLVAQEKEVDEAGKRRTAATNDLNRKGSALFRSLASLPRGPLDYVLIGLGGVFAFLLPLWLVVRLLLGVVGGALGGFMAFVLGLLSLVIVGVIVWQLRDRIARARIDFIDSFRRYADARANQIISRETAAFYPGVITAARERMAELDALYDHVVGWKSDFQRDSARNSHLVGKISFPLQSSLLTSEFIDSEYARLTTRLDELFNSFRVAVGTPDRWLPALEQLPARILEFTRGVFASLRQHTADSLLQRAPDDRQRHQRVQRYARDLRDKSAPMWNYNKFVVGKELTGSLSSFGLLAMDDPEDTTLDNDFRLLDPGLATVATLDPYRLQIIRLSHGYPLYGLRAFDDFRRHYQSVLQAGDTPLHTLDEYLVAEDPKFYPPGLDPHSTIAALFAVGRLVGIIAPEDGSFAVQPEGEDGTCRPLATTLKRSAARLSLEPELAMEVSRRIDAWVTFHTRAGAEELLKVALAPPRAKPAEGAAAEPLLTPPLEEWEQKALQGFIEQLRS